MNIDMDYIKTEAAKQCYWLKDGVFNLPEWTRAMMQIAADRAGSKINSMKRDLDACRPYLKEGETVADALKRLSERKTVRSLCEAYEACKPFLKDGEAPAECLARNRNYIVWLMGKWGAEKMTSARLRMVLDKIAQTTGSDDPCRPLVQIARDALDERA